MNPKARRKYLYPAAGLWLTVCVLYAVAWRAGFVTDAIDWLHDAQSLPIKDYLNRSNSTVHALYQTTQLLTLGLFKLFGAARLPWFFIFTAMQAGAAYLLFSLFAGIFRFANLPKPRRIAFWGAMLFCISPYISEVVVWKACFHYLEGLLLMLGVLVSMQKYLHNDHRRVWAWVAGGLYLLSAFTLEMFYLTPLLTASLLLYYRRLGWFKEVLRGGWRCFLLPQVAILLLHLLFFHLMYGEWASHGTGGAFNVSLQAHLTSGLKYAFHLVLFGRYWPQELKVKVYMLCQKPAILIPCYGLLLTGAAWLNYRARKGYGYEQVGFMLMFWTVLGVALAIPMPFEQLFDLAGNRYLYLATAFFGMLLSLAVHAIPLLWIRMTLACIWIGISTFLTLRTNRHWQTSERINESLLKSFPQAKDKITILLSMPYCYKGIPMINAWPQGNFARTHDALLQPLFPGKVYDGMAFNMISPSDGSVAEIVNDSTVKVTLQQWGTWWWYQDFGGYSYETPDYRINMRDQGHWYEIILKRPFYEYQLLYQTGDKWRWSCCPR